MIAAQAGTMGKAAKQLHMTQSAVSRSVAELEQSIGVQLFDRHPQGILPNAYGKALLSGGSAVFDDLRQTIKQIEFLSDPNSGQVIVGGSAMTSAGFLPAVIARIHEQHPNIFMQLTPAQTPSQQFQDLRDRRVDLIVSRVPRILDDEIEAEVLFRDNLVVIASANSKWAQRKKIELRELAGEFWCLPPHDVPVGGHVADAFRESVLKYPPKGAVVGSLQLFATLVHGEPFLGIYPESMLRFSTNFPDLRILPISLPHQPEAVGVMTLRHRTQSPASKLFVECARDVAKCMTKAN